MTENVLTGRKVLLIVVSAFAVIIGINLTMAYMAVSTFPGLEVKNTYVASQSFDAERRAQIALGWEVEAEVADGNLRLSVLDNKGFPVQVASLEGILGRPTHVGEDQTPEFVFDGNTYVAPVDLAPGNWNLRLVAVANDGTRFRQRISIYIKRLK